MIPSPLLAFKKISILVGMLLARVLSCSVLWPFGIGRNAFLSRA